MTGWTIVSAPSSAGAHHAGPERAPAAILAAGLVRSLRERGVDVVEGPVTDESPFGPADREPAGRDAARVAQVARSVGRAVTEVVRTGRRALVIGGDCTVSVGAIAGLRQFEPDVAVAYIDGDADLADPATSGGGVMDASGVAVLRGLIASPLASAGSGAMIDAARLAVLGFDRTDAGAYDERRLREAAPAEALDDAAVAADPVGAAERAAAVLSAGEVGAIHFDVDVVDSAELPLANFPHYGTGIAVDDAVALLRRLTAVPNVRLLSLTEVNPTHDRTGYWLERYVDMIARGFETGPSPRAASGS